MTQRHPISLPPLKVLLPPNNASQANKGFFFFVGSFFLFILCECVHATCIVGVRGQLERESVISFYHVGLQE